MYVVYHYGPDDACKLGIVGCGSQRASDDGPRQKPNYEGSLQTHIHRAYECDLGNNLK